MPRLPKYDWALMREEYVGGSRKIDTDTGIPRHHFPNLKEIAERHSCPYDAVRKRSKAENWRLQQDAVRAKIREKIQDDRLHSFVSESAYINAITIDKVQKIHKILDIYLKPYEEIFDENNKDQIDSDLLLELQSKVKIQDLEALTRLLERCQQTVQRIVNEKEATMESTKTIAELHEILQPTLQGADLAKEENAKNKRLNDLQKRKEDREKAIEITRKELLEIRNELKRM